MSDTSVLDVPYPSNLPRIQTASSSSALSALDARHNPIDFMDGFPTMTEVSELMYIQVFIAKLSLKIILN